MPFTWWQAGAFLGPIGLTLFVWSIGQLSGHKTTINASFTAGMELIDFSWLPHDIASAIQAGFAVATLMSNTLLTERKKENVDDE